MVMPASVDHNVLIVTHAAPGSELEAALRIVQKPLETTLHPPPNTLRVYKRSSDTLKASCDSDSNEIPGTPAAHA